MSFFGFRGTFLFFTVIFTAVPSLSRADELDPEPKVYYIHINPRGTYLSPPKCFPATETSPERCDVLQPPTAFSLAPFIDDEDIQLKAGDFISLQSVGKFDLDGDCQENSVGCEFDDSRGGVYAVFHGASGFLYPGPDGTTHGEEGAWADIPQDFVLDEGLEIWAQVPEGATELLFTPNDDFFRDNQDPNGDYSVVIKLTVVSCVKKVKVNLSEDEVLPFWESGSLRTWKKPQITVKAMVYCADNPHPDPKLVTGVKIDFVDVPKELSGGHDHEGGRPAGEFADENCTTDSSGVCSVKYTPPEIGGTEEIYAGLSSDNSVHDMKELKVTVPSLRAIGVSSFWVLVGDGPSTFHRNGHNHYVKRGLLYSLSKIANDFFMTTKARLEINDASLPNGGLFDIGPTGHTVSGAFWGSPHSWHREGLSVDIGRCAVSTVESNPFPKNGGYDVTIKGKEVHVDVNCEQGKVFVSRKMILDLCVSRGGHLIDEATYHCEFGDFK